MAEVFKLPDLGEGLREAEIVAWHVGVGDRVVADQPIVSVETDKAVVEVGSPISGRVTAIYGQPGDIVEVGTKLAEFATEAAADQATVVGELPRAEEHSRMPKRAKGESAPKRTSVKAAPAVRKLADELGVDLSIVGGTGPAGSITKKDVEAAAKGAVAGAGERVRGVRRAMLKNMVRAGDQIVRSTITDEADIDDWPEKADVTIRLVRAMIAGCRAAPSLNSWFDAETETWTHHGHVDLGIAVETDEGLFAPVIRGADSRAEADLRRALQSIKKDVAARSIPREALTGQTITLSNFGMFGGRFAQLVVVPPQVAIVGAGRVDARVVAVGGKPQVRRQIPLSLSFDHRIITGVEAARFLNAAIADLTKPT